MNHLLWERMLVTIVLVCFANRLLDVATADATYPALFAFGDSILDTGNNNHLFSLVKCNYAPYGRDLPNQEPTGRFCNGKIPTDIIASHLGIKQLVPAYLSGDLGVDELTTGVSFASGGSGNDDLTAQMQFVLTLSAQMKIFEEYIQSLNAAVGQQKAASIVSNGLYLFSSGNNDIALTHTLNIARSLIYFPIYADMIVGWASNFLDDLYNHGARHVWVLSTLPLGCLPGPRALAGIVFCQQYLNDQAQTFNTKLEAEVSSLKTKHPDFDIRFIDVYNPMLNLIQNPSSAGFVNVATGCCGSIFSGGLCNLISGSCQDPTNHFFWDSAHPTQAGYEHSLAPILQAMNISSIVS